MGQELECKLRIGKRTFSGKAYLETDHLLFRGEERVKVLFKDVKTVKAVGGILQLDYAGGPAALELGEAAEKWADKILHPPSRADKLGVKSGLRVRLVGDFDADFEKELDRRGAATLRSRDKADLIFLAAETRADLARVPKLIGAMERNGGLWVVYPKGVQEIREVEVIEAGRAAGLKDVKVASFSRTHTGLKFVVPVSAR